MTRYAIYPAIGVARVGDAPDDFYIGPETYRGLPTLPDGSDFTEGDFRDAHGRLRRQAARFRIYRENDDGTVTEMVPGAGDVESITWRVHLANKKASWYEFATNEGENGYAPNHTLRNASVTGDDRRKLIIDAGPRDVSGANAGPVSFDANTAYKYVNFPPGPLNPVNQSIATLGELRTDADGRLLVLGGLGVAGTTDKDAVITTYANNDGWWDDTSDGPVTATIQLKDGTTVEADAAWVLVAPPSYAPQLPNLVTLYDTIFDASVRAGNFPEIFADGYWKSGPDGYLPNFRTEIQPLLERGTLYPWVTAIPPKPHTFDFAMLGKLGADGRGAPDMKGMRHYILDFLRPPSQENVMIGKSGATMMPYLAGDNCLITDTLTSKYLRLTDTQFFFLQQWADGHFVDVEPTADPASGLTRAVLENCVGGAFSPGIEMTWISRQQAIYAAPFRIRVRCIGDGPLSLGYDPAKGMEPGDITRYMAIPWQADFNECSSQPVDGRVVWWWPAQRPEFVYLAPPERTVEALKAVPVPDEKTGLQVAWIGTDFDQKGSTFISFADDVQMVQYWAGLGFVMEKEVDGKPRFVEVARTLPRPFYPPADGE